VESDQRVASVAAVIVIDDAAVSVTGVATSVFSVMVTVIFVIYIRG